VPSPPFLGSPRPSFLREAVVKLGVKLWSVLRNLELAKECAESVVADGPKVVGH
jgi:hypothetical protein